MKKRYLTRVKQYGWIVLLCTVLSVAVGFAALKIQKPVYQASATLYVIAGAPGNSFTPSLSANDSIALATNYASQITSSSVMQYVYQFDPNLQKLGYGPDDLLADITTVTSATSSTFQVVASAANQQDAALLANDVANGFQKYIQTQTQQQLDAQRTGLQNLYNAAQKQKGAIEASLVAVASNTDPHFAVYQAELNDVLHTIDALEAQLIALPTTPTSNLAVIQSASPKSAVPVLKAGLLLALSAGLGLLLGTLVMLLVIYLDNRLQSEEQIREKLEMAFLGGVATSKALQRHPTRLDDFSAQQLADVGVNLRLLGILPDPSGRASQSGAVLLVTSARVSEGKTTLAAALTTALASAGNSVLLIDGNLQHPAAHLLFGGGQTTRGLSGLLGGVGNTDDAVQRTSTPGVWLLPAGAPVRAPALLLEQKLPSLLAHLRQKVDVVIVDGPALLSGSEAGILASLSDGVALVADARHDRLPLLLRARDVLNSVARVPAGVVLNRFRDGRPGHYYVAAVRSDRVVEANPAIARASDGHDSLRGRTAGPDSLPISPTPANFQMPLFDTPAHLDMAPYRPLFSRKNG